MLTLVDLEVVLGSATFRSADIASSSLAGQGAMSLRF